MEKSAMTDEEKLFVYALQGRLLALERLSEMFLMAATLQLYPGDPLKGLAGIEKGLLGNLQHRDYHSKVPADVPFEEVDAIIEAQGESLRIIFENVYDKLADVLKPPSK